jgi:hypothetical protein
VTYATRWARAWSILAAATVGFASLQWSLAIVALDLLFTGAAAAVCLVLYEKWSLTRKPGPAPRTVAPIGQRSLMISCCVVALSTLTVASSALSLLAVTAAAVTSPVVVRLMRGRAPNRWRGGRSDPGSTRTGPVLPLAGELTQQCAADGRALAELDDDELFRLWRRTFWELGDQPTVDQVACLVAVRQACLDELARRNPAALHAWLDSGARASGGPERFWRRHPHHGEPGAGS